jgi:5-methylcytosine-specific restriction enzyme A
VSPTPAVVDVANRSAWISPSVTTGDDTPHTERMFKYAKPPQRLPMLQPSTGRAIPRNADGFYSSAAWLRTREQVLARAAGRCASCRRRAPVLHVDHVKERKDGGADLDPRNLRALCPACHNRKTAHARAERHARVARRTVGARAT